jgi:transaldolase
MMGWILFAAAAGYIAGLATLAVIALYISRRDMRKIGAVPGNVVGMK